MKSQSKAKEYPIRELLSLNEYIIECQECILSGNYNEAMRLLIELHEAEWLIDIKGWDDKHISKSLYVYQKHNKKPVA